jgi:hypothetical protein
VTVLVVAGLALVVLLARGWRPDAGSTGRVDPAPRLTDMPTSDAIEQTYGVRFTAVVLTASDGVLQVRYQVLDQSKAAAVHEQGTFPYITASGATLDTPAMAGHGHGAQTPAGRSGSVLLTNTGDAVHPGDVVTVHMGELELARVQVV